jgi:hypothetical protein
MEEAMARKARSEAKLVAAGIPINQHLPIIDVTADTQQWQAAEAVARRCLILAGVQAVALRREAQQVIAWFQHEGLWPDVSRDEQGFLSQPSADRALQNALTWRAEALWTLWWALGIAENLSWPPGECDLGDVLDRPSGPQVPWIGDDASAFVASCVLRAADEILDETDLIYRVHWAVREAALVVVLRQQVSIRMWSLSDTMPSTG